MTPAQTARAHAEGLPDGEVKDAALHLLTATSANRAVRKVLEDGSVIIGSKTWAKIIREAVNHIKTMDALRAERDRAVEMLEMMQEWCDGGRIQSFPLGDGYGDYRPAHAEWADDARALIAEIDGEG